MNTYLIPTTGIYNHVYEYITVVYANNSDEAYMDARLITKPESNWLAETL